MGSATRAQDIQRPGHEYSRVVAHSRSESRSSPGKEDRDRAADLAGGRIASDSDIAPVLTRDLTFTAERHGR